MELVDYNQKFTAAPGYNDALAYGVRVLQAEPSTTYWRAIGVHHLSGAENRGNHHVYFDALRRDGKRMSGAKLIVYNSGAQGAVFIDKPANEPGANWPMYFSNVLTVYVDGAGVPSERVVGLSVNHPDEPGGGNTLCHHSFYVVFQLVERAGTLEEALLTDSQSYIMPINADAALHKFAQANDLGERLSVERSLDYDGTAYVYQVYERGLIYAPIGSADIKLIPKVS